MMNQVKLTDAAVEHIKSMITKKPNAIGFRLSIKKTGCSGYAYLPAIIEQVVENDIHFTAQLDLPIYIDPNAMEFIEELLIDYVVEEGQGLKQKRLVFVNPKEKGRCGCGESFTV